MKFVISWIKNHMTCCNIVYICIQSQDDLFSSVVLPSSIIRCYLEAQYILKVRFSGISGGCICRYIFKILINPSFWSVLLGGCDFIILIAKLMKLSYLEWEKCWLCFCLLAQCFVFFFFFFRKFLKLLFFFQD